MGLLDDAARAHDARRDTDAEGPPADASDGATVELQRTISVTAGGETVEVEAPATQQTSEEGTTWLSGSEKYGRPRGRGALEMRQIVQTSAMQSIVNGVAGQVLGGDLAFEGKDDVLDELGPGAEDTVAEFRTFLRDILEGPHLPNHSLDQLIVGAVEDMMGPGQAVWQLLGSADGSLPVVAMQLLDPLTVRMNIDEHNVFGDPPYWQASNAFAGGAVSSLGTADPVPLGHDDVAVLDYPYGTRSYQHYPQSPAWQVKEWLEILANSTTNLNRHYNDSEVNSGILQVVNASSTTVKDIKQKIENASGDPHSAAVVGGEGGAQWIELGGQGLNLNEIENQKWFFEMCLGALGLGKAEVGLIEDVNRSNGEVEATRVYKRVAGPFIDQFSAAFTHVAEQYETYRELGKPFTPTIAFSDPREERAREQRLREQLQAGAITPKQYARRTGDTDLAEDDDRWVVELGGEEIDYGEHPLWVTRRLMAAAGEGVPVEDDGDPDVDDGEDEEQSARGETETGGLLAGARQNGGA